MRLHRNPGTPGLRLLVIAAMGLVAVHPASGREEPSLPHPNAAGAGPGATQPAVDEQIPLPATPGERCAIAFLEAYNSGDGGRVRDFENRYRAVSALANRSIQDRVDQMRQIRADLGDLTLRRMNSTGPAEVTAQVFSSSKREEWTLGFMFEEQAPNGLISIRITPSSAPGLPNDPAKPVDESVRQDIVKQIAGVMREVYVDPETGRRMADVLAKNEADGRYAGAPYAEELARRWTADLLAVSRDYHLSVETYPRVLRGAGCRTRMVTQGDAPDDYGFQKSEVLPGNIGYVKFNVFDGREEARAAAAAALATVADCDALIFDLRDNGGGSPKMIRFVCSYLFDQPTHLDSFLDREGSVVAETWTLDEVPGRRFPAAVPVYVLTSSSTFSAAEAFAYDLKHLGRAKVVGSATGGGANLVTDRVINDRFVVRVPYQKAFNPITRGNWEGVGVEPDIRVPAPEALDAALKDAALGARR
jgi:retinol-binding protein 3